MTDKPAATGSGEPPQSECPFCGGSGTWKYDVLARPASQPTVTLDRETFDKVAYALARAARICDLEGFDEADKEMLDALALLRAAEQK